MNYLTLKLCLIGGLWVTGTGFCQSALEDEQLLKPGETLYAPNWQSKFTDYKDAPDYIANKTYGDPSGEYYLYLPASGTSGNTSSAQAVYGGGGCIYKTSTGTNFDLQLQLPDNHEIIGMRYYYYDNNASNSRAILFTVDNTGSFTTELGIDSTGDSGYSSLYTPLPSRLTVSNFNNRYGVRFLSYETSSQQQNCGVRLYMDSTP